MKCAEEMSTGANVSDECNNINVCVREATSLMLVENIVLPGLGSIPPTNIVSIFSEENILGELVSGKCDVVADYSTTLDEAKAREAGFAGDYVIGNALVAKEPMVVEYYDWNPEYATFLNWVVLALFAAAEHDIHQTNAFDFPQTSQLGKDNEDAFRYAVAAAGNMHDIYQRDKQILESGLPPSGNDISGAMTVQPLGPARYEGLDLSEKNLRIGAILKRGFLRCALRLNRPGFATQLEGKNLGDYEGMDVDFCRGLAAGVFDNEVDPPVKFVEVTTLSEGYNLLSANEVDVMAGATWTLESDLNEASTKEDFLFSKPYFYRPNDEE